MAWELISMRADAISRKPTVLALTQYFLAPSEVFLYRQVIGMRRFRVEHLHEMLVEDEIIFCGLMLLLGVIAGAVSRCLFALRARRAA